MQQQAEALRLALAMTRFASVTESMGEKNFATFLRQLILEEPYFAKHPENAWTEATHNDPHGRSNVFALVRRNESINTNTVVLTGHFDVVSAENYGPHQDAAFEPETLRQRLIEDLRQNARSQIEHRALADLESGDFLPGRGLLDMKSGLAAGLVTLYRFARQEKRSGNILFVAVADEENYSFGARSAAPSILALAKQNNLNIKSVINLDASSDHGDGTDGQAVYLGSVGKLLMGVFVAGQDVHAGYSLDGINANFVLGEIARRLEWNEQLTDKAFAEMAAPPTSLAQRDLKTHYDVTTPARAWASFNMLTLTKPATKVLEEFLQEAKAGLADALEILRNRAEALGKFDSAAHGTEGLVMNFAELLARAKEMGGPDFDSRHNNFLNALDTQEDLPGQSAKIVSWVWNEAGLLGPAVVLCFASLHYPAVCLDESQTDEAEFISRVRRTLKKAETDLAVRVKEKRFFAGISDMSWFGRNDHTDVDFINNNTPTGIAQLQTSSANLPTINLGPWGRDYHQWLERVHVPYSFGVLPELVWRLTEEFLT